MGRYSCAKGKKVTTQKANEFCLIHRCPALQVNYKNRKFRKVIPIQMIDGIGC